MADLDNDILKLWKQLTPEEKQMVLRRITQKASGIQLEPIRLEELPSVVERKAKTS